MLLPWYPVLLEAFEGLPISALTTIGRSLQPESLGPVPPNVKVTQWVDQRAVMARAAAVVHHGGSGTVLSSLESACPQLVGPLFADQVDNAAMVERAGLGLAVADQAVGGPAAMREPKLGDAHQIHDALQRLLAADTMRARSQEVADQMSRLPTLADLSLD